MKVCILSENYFHGGVASVLSSLAYGEFDDEIEFTLITNRNNPLLRSLNVSQSQFKEIILFEFVSTRNWFAGITPWSVRGGIRVFLDISRKILKPFLLLYQLHYFLKVFNKQHFDSLLNLNGGYPGSLSSRAASLAWSKSRSSGRQVMAIHNYATSSRFGFKLIDKFIDYLVMSAVDQVITVSESCKLSFVNRPSLNSHRNIVVIPNGVATTLRDDQSRDEFRNALSIADNSFTVLMLGSYELRKGHEFLLQSFNELSKLNPSVRLLLAGDDPNRMIEHLQKRVDQLRLGHLVTLLPFQIDVSGLLEACDIVAIPSQSHESFCLVAVDAFKYSKPIVATNIGAIPETAPHGSGAILCDPDDTKSFTEAMYRLATDNALYDEYSRLSGDRFQLFGVEKMVHNYHMCITSRK
jgi:glycosyltransferase involved in cell wall biosynthesis